MKKALILLGVILSIVLGFTVGNKKAGYEKITEIKESEPLRKCGFIVKSPSLNDVVSFPITIKGEINHGKEYETECFWTLFEGQAGIAEINFLSEGVWKKVGNPIPIPVKDWMAEKTDFAFAINSPTNLPSGTKIKIVFTEDDPSGRGWVDTLELPLTIQ